MQVVKRDGTFADYDRTKIAVAIGKANADVDENERASEKEIKEILECIEHKNRKRMLVEDIQDIIEERLMAYGHYELAKKYIIYRFTRALIRKANTTDEAILGLIRNSNKDLMEENSNKNALAASTQRDLIAGEVSKDLTRRILLPEKIAKAHDEGILHFHDADYFIQPIFNCCLINIGDMLDNGTVMNGKLIESPKSFQVACTITTQIIAAVACSQYGGQSVDIRHLGKYLRRSKEKFRRHYREIFPDITEEEMETLLADRVQEELKAGVQTIQYQINTLMTTNGQSPFVTLFLYLDKDDEYIEENAQIIMEILRQRYEGVKNEAGFSDGPASSFLTMNVVDTALLAADADMLAEVLGLLGESEKAKEYRDYARKVRRAFCEELCTEDGKLKQEMQGNYILALKYHMVPEEMEKGFATRLAEMIVENDYKPDAGFMSVPFILDVLCNYGYRDLAWKVLNQKNCPGWIYEVEHGATTMWENWDAVRPDGAVDKCSFNHYAFGCVGNFLYRRVLGIQNAGIGYDHICLEPGYDFDLDWAEGSYHSVHGEIRLRWEKMKNADGSDGAGIKVSGWIPANTEGELVLPDGSRQKLGSGGFELFTEESKIPMQA